MASVLLNAGLGARRRCVQSVFVAVLDKLEAIFARLHGTADFAATDFPDVNATNKEEQSSAEAQEKRVRAKENIV